MPQYKQTNYCKNTKSKIALAIVRGFLFAVFLILVIGLISQRIGTNETERLLFAIYKIFSFPLGFIMGYYFKIPQK